ncbi:c-type cytochrome [Gilvibacter sp.]|uniref:c-type cytochrome n=1 Tax=Gilvibacter sp. TaxID=2729997 RepID=UPI003B52BE10
MKRLLNLSLIFATALTLVGCFDESKPNYQYMPNMYEPIGYETYGDYEIFENGQSALLPAPGSIPRGWMPYDYEDTPAGKELATVELKNPHPVTQENLDKGKELYDIYCAVCHGSKGDGQGILMKNEVFLGIPSYADPGRNITEGSIYHVQMYGLNSMGSYASQTNELERWQITMHVQNLMAALKGTEPLTVVEPEAAAADAMEMMSDDAHNDTDEAH